MKIAIVGLGGVGGYFGCFLAKYYATNPKVEIYFVARGEHLARIRENGLTLITENDTVLCKPALATDNVTEIGYVDFIILATKSYDLDVTINQIKPIIGFETVILPLLNGIDNSERIRILLPGIEVWDGCCYIVAKINEPGVIENTGNVHAIHFGYKNRTNEKLLQFEKILKNAAIDCTFHENINSVSWRKFLFISTTASLTSYFNVGYGDLINDNERKNTFIKMLNELLLIANAECAGLDESEIFKIIHQVEKINPDSTTSMHRDFLAGKNTELQTLTGIVIELGKKNGIPTPTYESVFNKLSQSNYNSAI
jgi:2-dehydropantoate 2-reductase